ncbi:GNAT family N-acetyltransferase [Paenibacillus sp. GSMTC-2017]|uniref:GNAT family N-acetyltransferase n=1 Tax=Paenibacillus sp. GSMTC-2017 TaxID=2794350 RepID=UPI0018D8CCD7|nr:GNAT family N-acetyltransferase [Paenibacillus sp. GSMTC-2017]MBH5316439.1 GNAT family N-acetyltransferase [Paenibacillus sp. GSMTC-2017]
MKIRAFKQSDKDFIISLALRFMEFELMNWRDIEQTEEGQRRLAHESVSNPSPHSEMFVAEAETGELLGFVEVRPHTDLLSGIEQGFIVSIAVSTEGEGKGVGKALMLKAEQWSTEKGYKQLVLNAYMKNERAVNFYKYLNYEVEVLKMVKEL